MEPVGLHGLFRAAFYAARVSVAAGVDAGVGDNEGVSDPHLAAPFFAPRPARWGSLTPHMHVTVVRQNRALSRPSPSAPLVSRAVCAWFASTANTSDRFCPELAFI